MAKGFHAAKQKDEKQCPAMEVSRLTEIKDVTDQVHKALKGLQGKAYADKLKEVTAIQEKGCATDPEKIRCDLVNLYNGGRYNLYKYNRFKDVKLVFAPEQAIGHFGGDPDNFNFPRYSFDVAFLRIYVDGKPLQNDDYFRWSKAGAAEGELAFITGHPGRTQRLLTLNQLESLRDYGLPDAINELSEARGMIIQYQKKGKEEKRRGEAKLGSVENTLKALKGRVQALRDPAFFGKLKRNEEDFKKRTLSSSANKKKYGQAWSEIGKVAALEKDKINEIRKIGFNTFDSRLFGMAQTLVRASTEAAKPNEKRLTEYTDSRRPQLEQNLFSEEPIYEDLEKMFIEFQLVKLREVLSPDHPFVKLVLGKSSPEQLAKKLVDGTKLKDISNRKKLYQGGEKAIADAKDPMIELARLIDPDARKWRLYYEDEIDAKIKQQAELIAEARFKAYGTQVYPDATFSLRLSYGQVKGWIENGKTIKPFTHVKGLYERQTGSDPFELDPVWLKAQKALNPETSFNFVTTNDIIGGNSGSPVINKNAEIVGLVFDGNIHSLGGAYGYDESLNRAVSVSSPILSEALKKVYNVDLPFLSAQ